MPAASVTRTLGVLATDLWNLLADFGTCNWMPAGTKISVEGEGVGMTRIMGGVIREQLEALDPDGRTLVYKIHDEGAPFPATGYIATVSVSDAGDGAQLTWSCEAKPTEGTTPEQLKTSIEGLYGLMVGWIEDELKKA
jgi:hypothetical protein